MEKAVKKKKTKYFTSAEAEKGAEEAGNSRDEMRITYRRGNDEQRVYKPRTKWLRCEV